MNFVNLIYGSCKKYTGRELIHWPESSGFSTTTSDALLKEISYRRGILRIAGFKPGMRLMLVQPISPDVLCTMLALMAEGCTTVVPPPSAGWKFFFDIRNRVDGVVMVPQVSQLLRALLWLLRFPTLQFPKEQKGDLNLSENAPVDVLDEAIALISFSSGSTRKSQPILRTHGVLRAQHEAISRQFPAFEGQVDLPLFPNILLHHLAIGSTCVIPDIPNWKLSELNPMRIFTQIQNKGVNTLTGNVHYFKTLVAAANGKTFEKVKACGIGGSPVPENLLAQVQDLFPNAECYVIFGATEAEPIAVRLYQDAPSPWKGYAVGKPVEGIEVRLDKPYKLQLGTVNPVTAGEIQVRGAHVVSGPEVWHKTGDYGYLQNGKLFLTGRKGNEKVIDGWQHYPIEHGLRQVEGVEQVAAMAGASAFDIHYCGDCTVDELRKHLMEVLPKQLIGNIHKRYSLPLDQRHLSKIVYRQI